MRRGQERLRVVPCDLKEANDFVGRMHRHHDKVTGHKFSLAVLDAAGLVRGAAIVGRPVARKLDDGWTAEVTRVVTDGCPNACSALYGACWRVAREMGFRRALTYILASEPGTSLVASGWRQSDEDAGGGTWDRPNTGRRRTDTHPTGSKKRWEIGAQPPFGAAPVWPERAPSPQMAFELEPAAVLGPG